MSFTPQVPTPPYVRPEVSLESVLSQLTGASPLAHRGLAIVLEEIAAYILGTNQHPGLVRLATSADVSAGTDDDSAVTPLGLATKLVGAGTMTLASDAEAKAITNALKAVTPHNLGAVLGKLSLMSLAGHNLAGACTATGLKVNDLVLSVVGAGATYGNQAANFESTITVADQIQQSAAVDLSANHYVALIYHMS